MKKVLSLVVALILALSASAAFAESVEFFQQKMEEGPQRAYAEVLARFKEEYPDIDIEINTVPDAGTVLMQRIATGDIPPRPSSRRRSTTATSSAWRATSSCPESIPA